MSKPILSAQNLTLSFTGGLPVLNNVSLDLYSGKLLSIVGASGSGKTTLLRLLAGHLRPDAGHITFMGEPMEGPDIRLVPGYEEIKLVEQHSGLRPNITAEENLNVALLGFKEDYKKARLERLLELFLLLDYRKHYPRELSGGQQQRLTIACAMANEPAILLMDEPFSALDPSNTSILVQNIRKMAVETKTAIVLVTHDSRYALMGDGVMVIGNGRILQAGTPKDLYQTPIDEEVASFFGPVSVVGSSLKKFLNLPLQETFALRAEHIRVKKKGNGLAGKITSCTFMGIYHLLEIKLEKYGSLLAIDFTKTWNEGEAVMVEIPPRRVMHLPKAL